MANNSSTERRRRMAAKPALPPPAEPGLVLLKLRSTLPVTVTDAPPAPTSKTVKLR
jgi:hypothetical protein